MLFYCIVFSTKQVFHEIVSMIPNMESYLLFQSNISRLAKMKKTPDRLLYTLPYREQHTNTHRTQYKYFTSVYTYTNMYPLHKRYREQKKKKQNFPFENIQLFFELNIFISCENPLKGSLIYFTVRSDTNTVDQ